MTGPYSSKIRGCGHQRTSSVCPVLFAFLAPILLGPLGSVLISCSGPLLPAVGSSGEIGVVGNFTRDDPRLDLLTRLFGREMASAWGEPAFRLDPIRAKARRNWKAHIILLDLTEAADRKLARSLLEPSERKAWGARQAEHAFYRDVWAAGQAVLLLHAQDPANLKDYLDQHGEEIYGEFVALILEALGEGLFAGGEEEDLEARLRAEHGFDLRIPIGFVLEGSEGIAQIKRIVPEEPKRWLLVHHGPADKAPQGAEEWVALRDSVLNRFRDGDRILRTRSEVLEAQFQGQPCHRLDGIWQNARHVMGGPFRSYGFVREGRYFLIDLTVYHPPAPKLPSLRQLEAVARTFEIHKDGA
jgi:hypothetical protein